MMIYCPLMKIFFLQNLFNSFPLIIEARSCPKAKKSMRILDMFSSLLVTISIICRAQKRIPLMQESWLEAMTRIPTMSRFLQDAFYLNLKTWLFCDVGMTFQLSINKFFSTTQYSFFVNTALNLIKINTMGIPIQSLHLMPSHRSFFSIVLGKM